jgi:DNA primase
VTHGYDDKERVRQAIDIVDLAGSYLQLRRQGSIYVAQCPWHDDHRPSLQVNPARQSWKCWVCDIGGDVFSFVMKRESMDFREALELLAERAGISLSHRPSPKTVAGNPNDKPTLYRAMTWAAGRFHECLRRDAAAEPARRYLAMRGINEGALQKFQVGFAPNDASWLLEGGRAAGLTPDVLAACGLVASNDRGGWYGRFRGRLMFPIHDVQDRVIAFGGRILPEIAEEEEAATGRPPAKYINSPETRLYSKSEQLFGLNHARHHLDEQRNLIIVEGYTDVIAAWMAGIENAAAVCGTALNQRHIRIIRRFADRITLVLDGDAAGQRRTNEILEQFVAADVDLRIMTLPEGQDPCDFLQARGAADFRQRVATAIDALEHKIRVETDGIDPVRDTHAANQALDRILRTMAAAPAGLGPSSGPGLRSQQVLTRLSQLFQVSLDALQRRLGELRQSARRRSDREESPPARPRFAELPCHERELLQILLRDGELLDRATESVTAGEFIPGPCREVYELVCQCYEAGEPVSYESLMLRLEDPDLKHLLDRLDEESQAKVSKTEVELTVQLASVLDVFQRQRRDMEKRQSLASLSQPRLDPSEEARILEQMFRQARERQGIR